MKPIVVSFSTVTLHKIQTFLHTLDNEPMKTFESGQSSVMSEHKTKDNCGGWWPYSTSMFALLTAPLKFARFDNYSLY